MADDTLHTRDDNASEDLSSTRLFGCDKVVFGTLIVSVVALLLPTLLFFRSHRRPTTTTTTSSSSLTPPLSESHLVVPFIFLRDSDSSSSNSIRKPLEHTLRSTFTGYQRECSNAMTGLSKMLEMALVSEADRNYHDNIGNNKKSNNKAKDQKLLLSTKIERRIQRTAVCIEHDEDILKQLLGNFSYVLALPDKPYNKKVVVPREDDVNDIRRKNDILKEGRSTLFHLCDPRVRVTNQLDSYDSATQIWAHLVRDWTIEGQKIRHIIYDWCYDQMEIYSFKSGSSVLVPGAGMGRLAYDLSQRGYHVEANELSPSMAAAASSVLRNETYGIFHPYVLDAMSNEVDSKQRFGSVSFPDTSINGFSAEVPGSLSYTVGSFVGENDDYYQRQRAGYFDAVVTCFFIDTATNIYEYLDTIKELLKPGTGVWINVGPLQWHTNGVLRPSVDELKDLIESYGWSIHVWSIDNTAIPYRDESDAHFAARTTSYEGYRPLRFVAIRSE